MKTILMSAAAIYAAGFFLVFSFEVSIGPVTPGLAVLRAAVWPVYAATGWPRGQTARMD